MRRVILLHKGHRVLGTHPNIFSLGLVSFLNAVSSQVIFTPLPLFLVNVLGVKATIIGLIEGMADSTANLLEIISGWVSDKVGKRKFLTLIGYGLSTISKPFMYLASAWGIVLGILGIRIADRLGKGISTAPENALIADSAQASRRGKSFGLYFTMETVGKVVGLGIVAATVFLLQRETLTLTLETYRMLVLVGIIPAIVAVFILFLFVHERKKRHLLSLGKVSRLDQPALPQTQRPPKVNPQKRGFDGQFKVFLAIIAVFTLGDSSDAFLLLRAQNLGASTFHIVLMLVLFNIVYALGSLPGGILSDKLGQMGRKGVIALGWGIYVLVYLGFAFSSAIWQVWLLFAVYGLYYAASEGAIRALVADMVTTEKRGTAYGFYHGVIGVTVLPANLFAGWLWQAVTPAATFFVAAGMGGMAIIALMVLIRK